jgi:hypothetical protein
MTSICENLGLRALFYKSLYISLGLGALSDRRGIGVIDEVEDVLLLEDL